MHIIRQRKDTGRDYHSDWYDDLRLAEIEQERCGICFDLWPHSLMLTEDGKRRCPDCSANGLSETEKADIRQYDARQIEARQTRPQPGPYRLAETSTGTITSMTCNDVRVNQPNPLYLAQGGASKDIVCAGVDFASTDTVSASTGITISKNVDSSTQVTLTVSADGGTEAGDYYHLTYNGTTYRGILRVR